MSADCLLPALIAEAARADGGRDPLRRRRVSMVKYDLLVLRTKPPGGALALARQLVLCRQSR
jgi:hypothetical protein